jgi:hypothetical protein
MTHRGHDGTHDGENTGWPIPRHSDRNNTMTTAGVYPNGGFATKPIRATPAPHFDTRESNGNAGPSRAQHAPARLLAMRMGPSSIIDHRSSHTHQIPSRTTKAMADQS